MNSRERCLAVLQHKKPDRVPFFPLLMFFAADRAGLSFRTYATDPVALAEAQIKIFEEYRVDAVTVSSDAFRMSADLGAQMSFPENQTPFAVKPVVTSEHDLDNIDAGRLYGNHSRLNDRIRSVEILSRNIGKEALVCGWVEMPFAEVCDWFGVQNLMYLLIDDPAAVHKALDIATELEIGFALRQIEAGAEMIGCGDAAATLISPAFFEEFVLPYEQRVTDAIRNAKAWSKLHICGDSTKKLDLIVKCGADLINIDSAVDFRTASELFSSEKIAFKGNADPVRDILNSTPEKARETADYFVKTADSMPYMLSAGCELPAAVSDDVYKGFAGAAVEEFR